MNPTIPQLCAPTPSAGVVSSKPMPRRPVCRRPSRRARRLPLCKTKTAASGLVGAWVFFVSDLGPVGLESSSTEPRPYTRRETIDRGRGPSLCNRLPRLRPRSTFISRPNPYPTLALPAPPGGGAFQLLRAHAGAVGDRRRKRSARGRDGHERRARGSLPDPR